MLRMLLIVVALGSAMLLQPGAAVAAQRTAIALTVTRTAGAAEPHHKLADSLSALMELQILEEDALAVVERQQIELAIQELALSKTRSADESLQLGKLVTADLLVMLELQPPENKSNKPSVMLRVVEAKTAAIRGITVAPDLEEASLEEIAEQFMRYLSTVIREPKAPTITVAVAPFESVGRFDRLRPLELGIRDLVTAQLLLFRSPVAPRQEGRTPTGSEKTIEPSNIERPSAVLSRSDRATFQVVQRSNLEQLLREMDLIQSGFADKARLPRTLPDREAAFLIKGEIDERQVDGTFLIVVRGELRHAASAKIRASFEFECPPTQLEEQLTARVDDLAKHLGVAEASRLRTDVERADKPSESESLKSLALRDLHRFRRLCPIDFGHRAFGLTLQSARRNLPKLVRPNTPLGRTLLRKSIDRLETVLFIHPDDAQAAYGLGFCFSIHQPGIYRPERSDELLRKAASLQPQSELAALALAFLSELAFDDEDGKFDPLRNHTPGSHTRQSVGSRVPANAATGRNAATATATARNAAAERLWLAIEKTPVEFREHRWARILSLYAPLQQTAEQNAALLDKVVPLVEQAGDQHRRQLANETRMLATRLSSQSSKKPDLKAKAIGSMRSWADGSDAQLADAGRLGLATIHELNGEFLDAAKLFEISAAASADATSLQDQLSREGYHVKAAKNYRLAKQPDRALRLLQSFKPHDSASSLVLGVHGYEIGACYEALNEPKKALTAYLRAADECPGICSNSDLEQRVIQLGGVPLREDRDVDVQYVTQENKQEIRTTALATDGQWLFLGGVVFIRPGSAGNTTVAGGRPFWGGVGVTAFDPQSKTWQSLHDELKVTCLKLRDRELWVGTYDRGLWRYELDEKKWTTFGTEQGLPDLHVMSIAFRSNRRMAAPGRPELTDSQTRTAEGGHPTNDIFIGVGSAAGGGLVRLDEQGKAHVFSEPGSPSVAPTHLVVTDQELLARTLEVIHKWSWETQSWTRHPDEPNRPVPISSRLFAGTNGVWASNYGRELTRWNADEQANQLFKPAWYFVPGSKAGYLLDFVAERGDEVWFGGDQWDHFVSSGLYRINLKTGAFHKFTPADGFLTVNAHSIYDGVWLHDRLWLGTTNGLCVVTPRQ